MNAQLATARSDVTNDDYARIADAIDFLEAHWRRRPSLDEVASVAGLSKYHFQRVFSRWAGISPKRYVQYLTIDRARELLAEDRPLLDVSNDLDLSGPGRLHDLFVSIDAVTPGEFKRRGADLTIRFGVHASPFGPCAIGLTPRGICFLGFTTGSAADDAADLIRERWPRSELVEDGRATASLARRIFQTTARHVAEPLPLLLSGTNFQVKVWEALLRIPPGRVFSYEEIATAIGRPSAVRAVGSAIGANPISYVIPCHRVIRKAGHPGGYYWGLTRKRAMLWRESAQRAERTEE